MLITEHPLPPLTVSVSLKMYFGHTDALRYIDSVATMLGSHPALTRGEVELMVMPTYLAVPAALDAFERTPIVVGAQDVAAEVAGPFTGEVSAAELAEAGVGAVEVGHAERRQLFGETDDVVESKTARALEAGLCPVICVGEPEAMGWEAALAQVTGQLTSALRSAPPGRIIVAYEPVWAIGATNPATPDHIRGVCGGLRQVIGSAPGRAGSRVIYGGSAGPGLLSQLGDDVDGLFLGRFAHDPSSLALVVEEAARRVRSTGSAFAPSER